MARVLTYPTFAAAGHPLRRHSQESIERLESLKMVLVVRNRKGKIISAHFYGQARLPLQCRPKSGTRYSFQERLETGAAPWSLKRLPFRAIDAQLEYLAPRHIVEEHLKALYCAVPLSCMVEPKPAAPKQTANVVCIDGFRNRKPQKTVLPRTIAA